MANHHFEPNCEVQGRGGADARGEVQGRGSDDGRAGSDDGRGGSDDARGGSDDARGGSYGLDVVGLVATRDLAVGDQVLIACASEHQTPCSRARMHVCIMMRAMYPARSECAYMHTVYMHTVYMHHDESHAPGAFGMCTFQACQHASHSHTPCTPYACTPYACVHIPGMPARLALSHPPVICYPYACTCMPTCPHQNTEGRRTLACMTMSMRMHVYAHACLHAPTRPQRVAERLHV